MRGLLHRCSRPMVYIHADDERRLPHNADAACALYGALDSGMDIRLTSLAEVASGKFDRLLRGHLFAGSVDFMTGVFRRAGKQVVSLSNPFRPMQATSLAAARAEVGAGRRLFIKPVQTKLFTGMVFGPEEIGQLGRFDGATPVTTAMPFGRPIVSETRCYVHHDQIVDARNYAGDFRILPDFKQAEIWVQENAGAPAAYTLDIAVLDDGANEVVELNDMWAIGNYGMDNSLYYKLLHDRYFELMTPA